MLHPHFFADVQGEKGLFSCAFQLQLSGIILLLGGFIVLRKLIVNIFIVEAYTIRYGHSIKFDVISF
jgi:hypothetical protein